MLLGEINPSYVLLYVYTDGASPSGMHYYNGTSWSTYVFEKNMQGDVVAVYTNTGTLVTTYKYTAYGTMTVSTSGLSSHPAVAKHSVAYRGYFYDKDLGFYYCNSRYYDPNICRFISPDTEAVITATPMGLTDKNLYAYCDNNPVTRIDRDGEFWLQLVVGAAVGLAGGIINQAITGDWSLQGFVQTGISTLEGAATAVVGPAAGAIISGFAGAVGSAISGNDTDQIILDSLISAGTSLLGTGAQMAAGRVLASEFIDKASKTQLKTLANSLGYTGRNFKAIGSWTGQIMVDASKAFMQQGRAQLVGQITSFVADNALAYLSAR